MIYTEKQTHRNRDRDGVGRHPSQRDKKDKSHLHCTHCEMKKHTKVPTSKSLVIPNGEKIPN